MNLYARITGGFSRLLLTHRNNNLNCPSISYDVPIFNPCLKFEQYIVIYKSDAAVA